MPKRSLIVYASVTGNTEKVARKFEAVFEKKRAPWGEWVCDIYKVNKNSYRGMVPYHIKDYDFICIGAPIWAGIPPLYLFDDHHGALTPIMMPAMKPGKRPPKLPEGWGPKKGIVFVTYGGQGQGPLEATAALNCLEIRLEAARVKCVGKFACCGGMWNEPPVDRIASRFDWMVGDTTLAIAQYKENPNHPDFARLTDEERKLFDRAVKETREFKTGNYDARMRGIGQRSWHYDYEHRPTGRDLLKAEIFLSEILEDYYWGGVEMYPFSQYVCIA